MKKKLLIIPIIILTMTGCFKKDTLENATVYTTIYPIEYITQRLYNDNGVISSVYPNDINVKTYQLTDKQLTDYSSSQIFIYNGLGNEKDYAIKMLNKNKDLLIIDAAMGMEYINNEEEIWLDLSNFLMAAQNIKEGFKEYITNSYLKRVIDDNYEDLKIDISEIDAEINLIAENASDKSIVVADNSLLFLQKYGLDVYSLEEGDDLTAKKIADVEKLMKENKIKYIFGVDNNELTNTANQLASKHSISVVSFKTGVNLSQTQRDENVDYISIMKENIELLKKELYQ